MSFLDIFNFNKLPFPNEQGKIIHIRTKEIEENNALIVSVDHEDQFFTRVLFACYSEGADILANYIQTATVGLGGVDVSMLNHSDHLATGYKVTIDKKSSNAALCEAIVATILNTRFQCTPRVFSVKLTSNPTRNWLSNNLGLAYAPLLTPVADPDAPVTFSMVHYRFINGNINVSHKTANIAFKSVLEHIHLFTASSSHLPGISHVSALSNQGLTLYTFE